MFCLLFYSSRQTNQIPSFIFWENLRCANLLFGTIWALQRIEIINLDLFGPWDYCPGVKSIISNVAYRLNVYIKLGPPPTLCTSRHSNTKRAKKCLKNGLHTIIPNTKRSLKPSAAREAARLRLFCTEQPTITNLKATTKHLGTTYNFLVRTLKLFGLELQTFFGLSTSLFDSLRDWQSQTKAKRSRQGLYLGWNQNHTPIRPFFTIFDSFLDNSKAARLFLSNGHMARA